MDIWTILYDVVVLLGVGALLGTVAERLKQSAIVGYLVGGALLGPNMLHMVESSEEVLAVSELGVALLLFAIGLEFSWSRLARMGRTVLGSGALQVGATLVIGTVAALLAGLGIRTSLALGAMLALSSTACVLRVLQSQDDDSPHGEHTLGVLLVQDISVLPLVLMVTALGAGDSVNEMLLTLGRTALIGSGLIAGLWFVFQKLVPRLLESAPMRNNQELPLLVAIVSGLGSGVAAHAAGISPALGAFIAGMLLAESPFADQARSDVSSLKVVMLALFFSAIGMLADPIWIASNLTLVLITVSSVMLVKAAVVWGAMRAFGVGSTTALATGLSLAQTGEFSFVLADVARGGLLDHDLFMLVVSTTVITMLLTPTLVARAPRLAGRLVGRRAQAA